MYRHLLSPYHHQRSLIHRLPASVKLASAVAFIFAVVLAPRSAWVVYAAAGALLLGIAAISRIPPIVLAKRLLGVEAFALGVALLSLLQENGLPVFAAMLVKSTLCLFCMVLLAGTTRFTEVLRVLWRVRVPSLLVTTLALMHRYLFLMADEMGRMQRARRSRTFSPSRRHAWWSSATVIAHLFVRTSERAERIYAAMWARGWKT